MRWKIGIRWENFLEFSRNFEIIHIISPNFFADAKKDKCGVCKGDGSGCKTVEGLFDERSLATGYHDIVALPVGATAIHIEELRPTSNVFGKHKMN
jgi:hypothetical protein